MADDDPDERPVVVKRAVYDAGMKLEAEVDGGADGPAFSNAEDKATSCRAAGDSAGGGVLGRGVPVHDDPRVRGRRNENHHP